MLAGMRHVAGGFFAKVLLLLLIASFAVWGIGDIFRGTSDTTIANVGNYSISTAEYENSLSRVKQNFGANVPPELFIQLDIPNQLLQSLINQRILLAEGDTLGIRISDDVLIDQLKDATDFKNDSGNFDRDVFNSFLRNNQLSEQRYLIQLQQRLAAELLEETITANSIVPESLVQHMFALNQEQRIVHLLHINSKKLDAVTEPDDETLVLFFANISNRFMQPEKRKLGYVVINPEDMKHNITIEKSEIEAYYQANKNEYKQEEQRTVRQLIASSKEDADALFAAINEGASLKDAPKKASIDITPLELGTVEKSDVFAGAADTVFSLSEGEISFPVQSSFGWHLFEVTNIKEGMLIPRGDVSGTIRTQLEQEKLAEHLQEVSIEIEDAIAGGTPLNELAESVNAPYKTSRWIDNTTLSNQSDIPEDIFSHGLTMDPSYPSSLMVSNDGKYFIVEVIEHEEARPHSLEEVRSDIVSLWKTQQKHQQLRLKADSLREEMRTGSFSDVAKNNKMPIIKTRAFKRDATSIPIIGNHTLELSAEFIRSLFALPKDEASSPAALSDGTFAIGMIADIIPVSLGAEDKATTLKETKARLIDDYKNELFGQYLLYLRNKHDVSVNREAYERIVQQ